MDINIFLLCFNEMYLLPHVVKHYKQYLPSCKITIYDNESTDNSVEIAKSLGCSVISFHSGNCLEDYIQINIKNNCWKYIEKGWIIVADMDEFLCITENELFNEMNMGTSILRVKGYDMIGESNTMNLSDIDLQQIKKYVDNYWEDKKLCFLREKITEINYTVGAHICQPVGQIQLSEKLYINKHMSMLGLDFLINKYINRYKRTEKMRQYNLAIHYTDNIQEIHNLYYHNLNNCKQLE